MNRKLNRKGIEDFGFRRVPVKKINVRAQGSDLVPIDDNDIIRLQVGTVKKIIMKIDYTKGGRQWK